MVVPLIAAGVGAVGSAFTGGGAGSAGLGLASAPAGNFVQGVFGNEAAKAQLAAAEEVLREQRQIARQQGINTTRGFNSAQEAVQAGTAGGLQSLQTGATGAQGAIQGGLGQAVGSLGQAQQALGGFGALQAGIAAQGPLSFQGFAADPGFQFRQQQGEQAINRAAAARGGRLSGRTLQELGQFNQGLASQEFQNFANRQLAAQGLFQQAAAGADQAQLQQLGQLGGLLGQQAGLQFGAGTQQAGILSQLGQQQAGLQTAEGAQLSNLFTQEAAQRNAILANLANQIAAPVNLVGQGEIALGNAAANAGAQTQQGTIAGLEIAAGALGGGAGGGGGAPKPPA